LAYVYFGEEGMRGEEFIEEEKLTLLNLTLLVSHTIFSYKIEPSCALFFEVQIPISYYYTTSNNQILLLQGYQNK